MSSIKELIQNVLDETSHWYTSHVSETVLDHMDNAGINVKDQLPSFLLYDTSVCKITLEDAVNGANVVFDAYNDNCGLCLGCSEGEDECECYDGFVEEQPLSEIYHDLCGLPDDYDIIRKICSYADKQYWKACLALPSWRIALLNIRKSKKTFDDIVSRNDVEDFMTFIRTVSQWQHSSGSICESSPLRDSSWDALFTDSEIEDFIENADLDDFYYDVWECSEFNSLLFDVVSPSELKGV